MNKQSIVIGITLLVIVTALCGCIDEPETIVITTYASDEEAIQALRYLIPEYAYGFTPPTGWTTNSLVPYANYSYSLSIPDINVAIFIGPASYPTGTTITTIIDDYIESGSVNLTNFTLISRVYKIINGINAQEIVYTYDDATEGLVQEKDVWAKKGDNGLWITYDTTKDLYATYLPAADQFIESMYIFDENSTVSFPINGETRTLQTEFLGGTYNTSLLSQEFFYADTWRNTTILQYTKNDRDFRGDYYSFMQDTLEWIRTNTNTNSTVLCWWDYGHMIEGYAERNAIATFASRSLEYTIRFFLGYADEVKETTVSERGGWAANETIEDIAQILTAGSLTSTETSDLIQKYNVSYILTTANDPLFADIIFNVSGKNRDDYFFKNRFVPFPLPNDSANETLFYQMWKTEVNVSNLALVFEDLFDEPGIPAIYPQVRVFKVEL